MNRLQTILTLILTLTMLSCGTNNQSDKNDLEFNSKKWKSGDMQTKGKMTDNLVNDSLLIGKTKTEVLKMLGEPDQQTESRLHYTVDLGIEYMSEPWTYWLSVDIDTTSGKVDEVWIVD